MSEIVASSNSTDKSDIVENLKRRLAILCCNSILNPPLEFVGALRIHADDTDEEKEAKREEHKAKTEKREEERKRREPELMEEMSNIMKRIYDSRREPLPEDGGDYDFGAMRENKTKTFGNGAAGSLPTYLCEICKNTQEENFFIDTTSGDTICLGTHGMGKNKLNFAGDTDWFLYILQLL